MVLSFMLDMGVSPKVAALLRSRGHDAVHVSELGMAQADDRQLIDSARQKNSVLITTDKDLANHVALSRSNAPSVITLRLFNPNADEQHAAVQALLDALPAPSFDHCLITLEPSRFRRRPLPIR